MCLQKLTRLQALVAARKTGENQIVQVKRMRQWVLDAEHILDGSWATAEEAVSNEQVARRFDHWRQTLAEHLDDGTLSPIEQECLEQFLQVLSNLRPYLIHCYDRQEFPRTNNDTERGIRALKTGYRRISGRKNWNSYLLRSGRCIAFYDWWQQDPDRSQQLEQRLTHVTPNTGGLPVIRAPRLKANNSSAFAFIANEKLISPHLRPDGLWLLTTGRPKKGPLPLKSSNSPWSVTGLSVFDSHCQSLQC